MLKKMLGSKWISLILVVIIALTTLCSVSASSRTNSSNLELTATSTHIDLTGKWSCNDGGTYYIRQVGKEVMWFGENLPTSPWWSNVSSGTIDGTNIILRWMDVTKGGARSEGILVLVVSSDGETITSVTKTGGFGGSVWKRE